VVERLLSKHEVLAQYFKEKKRWEESRLYREARHRCLTPAIQATQEAEIRRIVV
jgi:hypothetical protein